MEEKEKIQLEEILLKLKGIRGRHTELITVMIPAGFNKDGVVKQLEAERSTADNIKSKNTRKSVMDALERIVRFLKTLEKMPEHGLAIYCGNTSETEGQEHIELFYVEPPRPLRTRIYRCDQTFVIEPLEEMLESQEVYGLAVMDRREATIGLLDGKQIIVLRKLTSGVPGKIKAGGQCLSPETLIMKDTGEILELKDAHNPLLVIGENFNKEQTEETPIVAVWENEKELFKVITKYPRLEIQASEDHVFFVRTEKGIEEKQLSELREGDFLIMPEKIHIRGKFQKLSSKKYYNSFILDEKGRLLLRQKREEKGFLQRELAERIGVKQTSISYFEIGRLHPTRGTLRKLCEALEISFETFLEDYTTPSFYGEVHLPEIVDEDFARFLGYYLGDGCSEEDRITFFEQREEVAKFYISLIKKLFGVDANYRFRDKKNYHQIRITRRPLVRLLQGEFSELRKAVDSQIPKKILISPDSIVAAFISGLFDAEGYISSHRVALGVNNHALVRQLQLCLLRLGILSSVLEYDNKRNPYSKKIRYSVVIDDGRSLLLFRDLVGFASSEKRKKLEDTLKKRSMRSNVRQLAVNGKEIARILRNSGLTTTEFNAPDFFTNKKQMSKEIFKKNIIDKITEPDLKRRLELFYQSNLIITKIHTLTSLGIKRTIDIETKGHNFMANGLIVHNSAARFERLTESLAIEFYKRIAAAMKTAFFDNKKLKGILIGGPIPTKDEFLRDGELVTALKEKVIGVRDLGDTDESGLKDLVELSGDIIAQQEIIREKKILEEFFFTLGKHPDMSAYGEEAVKKALGYGAVRRLILSKKISKEKIRELSEMAINISAEIEIVSVETPEGEQFFNLAGIGAILRFKI